MKKYKSFLSAVKEVYKKENQGSYRSLKNSILDVITPGNIEKGPEKFTTGSKDIPVTKEKPDKDVANTMFAISRSIRAQRKLKIIDD